MLAWIIPPQLQYYPVIKYYAIECQSDKGTKYMEFFTYSINPSTEMIKLEPTTKYGCRVRVFLKREPGPYSKMVYVTTANGTYTCLCTYISSATFLMYVCLYTSFLDFPNSMTIKYETVIDHGMDICQNS